MQNSKGTYDSKAILIKSNNPASNRNLATSAKTKDLVQKIMNSRDEFESDEAYKEENTDKKLRTDEIKQHLLYDNIILKKYLTKKELYT